MHFPDGKNLKPLNHKCLICLYAVLGNFQTGRFISQLKNGALNVNSFFGTFSGAGTRVSHFLYVCERLIFIDSLSIGGVQTYSWSIASFLSF
jgi:hypothetical protein